MKKLVLFAAAFALLFSVPNLQPHQARAETSRCVHWPADQIDNWTAGYYITIFPQGEQTGIACTP